MERLEGKTKEAKIQDLAKHLVDSFLSSYLGSKTNKIILYGRDSEGRESLGLQMRLYLDSKEVNRPEVSVGRRLELNEPDGFPKVYSVDVDYYEIKEL